MKNLKRWQFYLLSFTWGLPMSLMGLVVCAVLMCFGKRPKRYGHCYYMNVGKHWGGVEFGWFFLIDGTDSAFIKRHELGHGYQNACILGWVYPIFWLVAIARYWLKRWGAKFNYYGWWLEDQANKIGQEVMSNEI